MDERFERLRVECKFCMHYQENPHFMLTAGADPLSGRRYCVKFTAMGRMVHAEHTVDAAATLRQLQTMPVTFMVFPPENGMCWLFARHDSRR